MLRAKFHDSIAITFIPRRGEPTCSP